MKMWLVWCGHTTIFTIDSRVRRSENDDNYGNDEKPQTNLHGHHERESRKTRQEGHPHKIDAEVQYHEALERRFPQEVHEQPAQLEPLNIRRRQIYEVPCSNLPRRRV